MTQNPPAMRMPSSKGFTLVELLVVVGIIALLVSIVVVVSRSAFGAADKARLTAQLQTIEKALEAYKTDFGSFPVTSINSTTTSADDLINADGYRGARLLCKALIAPTPQGSPGQANTNFDLNRASQDGAEGPGFRVPPRSGVFKLNATDNQKLEGKVYGPYISGGAISYGKPAGGNGVEIDTGDKNYDDTTVLADANANVILYYPVLNSAPPMTDPQYYFGDGLNGTLPMWRQGDNSTWISVATVRGELQKAGGPKNKYLLISAGRDGKFGPNQNEKENANDDVTNFAN